MRLPGQTAAPVPVTVNGITIPADAIAAEAQNHPVPKGKPGWAWRAATRALVLRELILQEARASRIEPKPIEFAEGRRETEEEALIRQLLEITISAAELDEATLRAIYDRAPERFRGPSLFEAAHILIPAVQDDKPSRDAARATADAVVADLSDHPQRFAALAAKHSACPSRSRDGLLGQLSSGDTVPEFEAALNDLEVGTISGSPVESQYGFHIIRLDARIEGEILPFSAVRPQLREAQEKAAWLRASCDYVEGLVLRADITGVNEEDFRRSKE